MRRLRLGAIKTGGNIEQHVLLCVLCGRQIWMHEATGESEGRETRYFTKGWVLMEDLQFI